VLARPTAHRGVPGGPRDHPRRERHNAHVRVVIPERRRGVPRRVRIIRHRRASVRVHQREQRREDRSRRSRQGGVSRRVARPAQAVARVQVPLPQRGRLRDARHRRPRPLRPRRGRDHRRGAFRAHGRVRRPGRGVFTGLGRDRVGDVQGVQRRVLYTGPHTTAFAWCSPILKDFVPRVSPPTPRFQSPPSTPFNST
jgi:hypothetical protein